MKRILFYSISFLLFSLCGNAQTKLTLTQKREMIQKSVAFKLDVAIVLQVEKYASEHHYDLHILQKNTPHLQVIFNNDLHPKKRIAYCSYLIALWKNDNTSLPISIIQEQQRNLIKKKTDD